jgi:hypothetical protein
MGCPANNSNGNNVELPDADSDGDGMPNAWETAHGLNPNDPNDASQDSDGDGYLNNTDPFASDAAPAPWNTLTWTAKLVDSAGGTGKAAGTQGKLKRDTGGTLYYAFLKQMATTPDCDIAVFGGGSAPMVRYDLRVATLAPAGTTWAIETVPLDSSPIDAPGYVNTRYGVDATFDSGGRLAIVVAAGGPGLASCGSTDVVLAVRNGASWDISAPVTGSNACCDDCAGGPSDPCTTTGTCQCCAVMQNACRVGTDVGAWSAIALCNGSLAVAFTDYHNFWDQDGQTGQGFEILEGGTVTGVRPWSGLGLYSALACPGGTPIAAVTGYKRGGLDLLRRSGTTWTALPITAQFEGWGIGERIQLATAADGTVGLAFHAKTNSSGAAKNELYYCSSSDAGATWSICTVVDINVGGDPSLAVDKDNHPALSYYYCGGASCSVSTDRPRLAWRDDDDKWWKFDVSNEANNSSGQYSSLVFDATTGAPTVAFQDLTRGAAMVAQGKFGN